MKKKDEITAELKILGAGFHTEGSADTIFDIPQGYFRQFPDQMMSVIQHMNEETSFDIAVEKDGPYSIPAQYFEQLSHELLLKVEAMDAVVHEGQYSWQDENRANPFALPDGYFTHFEKQVFSRIFQEEEPAKDEIDSLSPLLAGLSQQKTFHVPENYFEQTTFGRQPEQQEVQTKVLQHPSVKSIKWARWAAAAAVLAIFTLGGFHYLLPSTQISGGSSFEQSLAKIPDARIKEWLSNNMDESDINNLGGSLANISSITTTHSLKSFSEEEIKDYLETETW